MTANYVLLEKITVGAAGASSITFSGIPQTGYTDLVVKCSIRSSADNITAELSLNGVKTNMTQRYLQGTGSAAQSGNSTAINVMEDPSSATASTFASADIYIPNYTSSDYKSISIDTVTEKNATDAYMRLTAGLWSNTAAITSIGLNCSASGNFVQYSTFYLYGVAKLGTTPAIVPYATGGDTIMTDGTYWYHTFISSGTFTPAKSITCDYLVVAGGGGGSTGGGGAGGLRSTVTATGGGGSLESALSLALNTAYTVTVGAGGAGNDQSNVPGGTNAANGSNSVFSTITSTGGGGGAANKNVGSTGGSGGGSGYTSTTPLPGASSATANQGFAGGAVTINSSSFPAGGGGGAGVSGGAGSSTTVGGSGGNGVATSITGSSVTYAGGGGGGLYAGGTGGTGGTGGGGAGSTGAANGTSGTANTGGGAGGAGNGGTGGNGGSGIVIVRYAV
jgi:hypothetical protein